MKNKQDLTAYQIYKRENPELNERQALKGFVTLTGSIIVDIFILIGGLSLILPAVKMEPSLYSLNGMLGIGICTYALVWTFKRMDK